ncbi:MAG: site-specific DNA-methyltransferase [Verrucomicrobiaceae bacterium]|nr:site-specific DNA-methyltransferase [Verrucomicrobiaceae bacterium]
MDKLNFKTANGVDVNLEKLSQLFPEAITETKDENGNIKRVANLDILKTLLNGYVADPNDVECYEFTWPGKREAIMEAAKSTTKTLRPCPEESKNWDTTQNLYIEGDNLEVLKLLQESYLGKVKMIYIDPPYNTGKDFVYRDNFNKTQSENQEDQTVRDEETDDNLFQNTESNGRFHSDWCSMIYPRLKLARDLLSDDGVIFISIDDNEVINLKKICDEIFGESNFLIIFPRVTKKGGKSSDDIAKNHDYVLSYVKNANLADLKGVEHNDSGFSNKDEFFEYRGYYKVNQTLDYDSLGYVKSLDYPIEINGEIFYAGGSKSDYEERQKGNHARADWGWRWRWELFQFALKNGFIEIHRGGQRPRIYTKTYQNVTIDKVEGQYKIVEINRTKPLSTLEFTENLFSNDNAKKSIDSLLPKGVFDYTKPPSLIKRLCNIVNQNDYIILDFFSGSATTAHACMQLNAEDGGNRKFIMVQLPEVCAPESEASKAGYKNICEIGKERIRRAGEKIKAEHATTAPNLDIGFRVLKLDESNMKEVYYKPDELSQDMLSGLESNIKEDRNDLDLLYACLIDWGVELALPLKTEEINGVKVYTVNDSEIPDLIACFSENIPETTIREIAKRKPLRVVFRDSSFADSPSKINVTEIFKTLSPNTTIKVL